MGRLRAGRQMRHEERDRDVAVAVDKQRQPEEHGLDESELRRLFRLGQRGC